MAKWACEIGGCAVVWSETRKGLDALWRAVRDTVPASVADEEGEAEQDRLDIHLAWRAEGCACAGGEALVGVAPWVQLRAMCPLLTKLRVTPEAAKLVLSYGDVVPLDVIVAAPGDGLDVVDVEGEARQGFRSAMVTTRLLDADADRYIDVLSAMRQDGAAEKRIGFLVIIGARDDGAALVAKVSQARTVRLSELPQLVQERSGGGVGV